MIIKSTLGPHPDIPLQNAVATFFESPALNDPATQDKRLFIDSLSDQGYTIGEFRKLVPRAAALFRHKYDVQKDDVVGLFGVNHIFTPIIHLATLSLGATLSPANIMYSAEELAHQLRMTQPKVIIVFDPVKPVVEEATKLAGCSSQIVTFSALFAQFAALVRETNAPEVQPVEVDAKKQTAYLCFSSGTSGLPKGVITTHYNIIGNTLQLVLARSPLTNGDLSQNALLPMSHIYGLNTAVWAGPYSGKMSVVFPKFDLELLVKKTIEYKLELLFLVPPIMLLLGKTDILEQNPEFGETVQYIMSGAAPLSKRVVDMISKKAPKVQFFQGYGLTETTPVVSTGFHHDPAKQATYDQESIGWLVPGVEARLVDPATNADVTGKNQRGELWVRGPMVMAGYLKNPQANAEVFADGGWFKTGDIAIFDEHDQFYIVDRIKELIKSNGHQVAPAELEAILLSHEDVLDSAVIGVLNDSKTSEMPRAFLVLRDGADVNEVIKWFNKRVAKHKRLWGGAVLIDVVPKSASGKILRNDLRKRQGDVVHGMDLVSSANL